jgi:hypothetical protein
LALPVLGTSVVTRKIVSRRAAPPPCPFITESQHRRFPGAIVPNESKVGGGKTLHRLCDSGLRQGSLT